MIDYPLWQVISTYYLCFFNTIYIIVVKPFNSKILNYSEIFNEISLFIASIHLFLYTDYMLG